MAEIEAKQALVNATVNCFVPKANIRVAIDRMDKAIDMVKYTGSFKQ
ncbi:MAG: hypothetical protein V4706_14065 [Pseudomonadota bacterium]